MGSMFFTSESTAFSTAAILLLILVVVLWFVIATAAALKGAGMDPPNRIAQMYGYTVCLIAVIVGLTSITAILDAAFDRAHPLQAEFPFGAALVSFDAFKATLSRERMMMGPQNASVPDTSSDATLRKRYNALLEERRAATTYRTNKTFVTSGLLFVIALALFFVHWRWLGRIGARPRALAGTPSAV